MKIDLTTEERNLSSTQWVEYHNGTKRKSYNTPPTSDITAEAVSVDGFTLSQADNAGESTSTSRSLAIQLNGTWYPAPTRLASQGARSQVCSRLGVWLLKSQPAYGCDLTKNIYELYGTNGYICTAYTYAPYGDITESGSTWLPIQWSSEYNDAALGLVYYNYRHYNPIDGRWIGRDRLELSNQNTYNFTCMPIYIVDILGEKLEKINADDISSQEIGSNRHHGGKTNCKINDDTTFPKNPTDENYRTPINLN